MVQPGLSQAEGRRSLSGGDGATPSLTCPRTERYKWINVCWESLRVYLLLLYAAHGASLPSVHALMS